MLRLAKAILQNSVSFGSAKNQFSLNVEEAYSILDRLSDEAAREGVSDGYFCQVMITPNNEMLISSDRPLTKETSAELNHLIYAGDPACKKPELMGRRTWEWPKGHYALTRSDVSKVDCSDCRKAWDNIQLREKEAAKKP